jgi:hypothetical protein
VSSLEQFLLYGLFTQSDRQTVAYDTTRKIGSILFFVVPCDTTWNSLGTYLSDCVRT